MSPSVRDVLIDERLRRIEELLAGRGPKFAPIDQIMGRALVLASLELEEYDVPVDDRMVPGQTRYLTRVVVIDTADNPVKGPDFPLPFGTAVSVRMRRATSGSPNGYVGGTREEVGDDLQRNELKGGEAVFDILVGNFSDIWMNADTTNVKFEMSAVVPVSALVKQKL